MQTYYSPRAKAISKGVVDTTTHARCIVCSRYIPEWLNAGTTMCSIVCRMRVQRLRAMGQEPDGHWVNRRISPTARYSKNLPPNGGK